MKEIKYIPDKEFENMTKKQKLEIPEFCEYDEVKIDRLVISPANSKSDGYFTGNFFAHTPNKGWWRPMRYDCWKIVTDMENPITPRYQILRGDFENGGVHIFGFVDECCEAFIGYGGQITIKNKPA